MSAPKILRLVEEQELERLRKTASGCASETRAEIDKVEINLAKPSENVQSKSDPKLKLLAQLETQMKNILYSPSLPTSERMILISNLKNSIDEVAKGNIVLPQYLAIAKDTPTPPAPA